jgi:hypothetical protein
MAYEMWLVTMYNKSLLNTGDNGESMAYEMWLVTMYNKSLLNTGDNGESMVYEMWLVTMYNKSLLDTGDNGESMAYVAGQNKTIKFSRNPTDIRSRDNYIQCKSMYSFISSTGFHC